MAYDYETNNLADEMIGEEEEENNQEMIISNLASHVQDRWQIMRDHKKDHIEERLKKCQRMFDMEYDPDILSEIKSIGGSEIYMGIVSIQCRTAISWLHDTLRGQGTEKPWSIKPTPLPEPPQDLKNMLQEIMQTQLAQYYMQANGEIDEISRTEIENELKEKSMRELRYQSEKRVERMEKKIEDQLSEGHFYNAIKKFIHNLTIFPFSVLKGPIIRKYKKIVYTEQGMDVVDDLREEWECVDPFKFYWAPWGDDINKIPVIELHHLTREQVENMIGQPGYDEEAVRETLQNFGNNTWLDYSKDVIENLTDKDFDDAHDDIAVALQLWDRIPGEMLIQWGMSEKEIPDREKSYPCEVWKIGNKIIKAILNYDILGRKPYYATSYEVVPGKIDGNGIADLCKDCQAMCNAAARALANNMGISSGPQVGINVSRLAEGEDIEQMRPWKIWQFQTPQYNDNNPPISFFQPNSNIAELDAVYEKYRERADEITGIPKYMRGGHVPGVSRTSSGLSILVSNAGKVFKQVISNIDNDILQPMIERQYQHNLYYAQDPDFVGDVNIVPMGAMSLVVKEAESVRKSDFLRVLLSSEAAQQVVGLPGVAELLRDLASDLNIDVDRLVPSREDVIQRQEAQERAQQEAMQQQAMQQEAEQIQRQEDGTPVGGRESNYISPRPNGV